MIRLNRPLPEGWRVSEPYVEMRNRKEFERILEEVKAGPRPPPPVIPDTFNGKAIAELTEKEREAFIVSLQPESTKKALELQKTRAPEDDIDWVLRPMPACLANPEAKNKDELVSKRALDPQEVTLVEGMRRQSKNTVGTSSLKSFDEEKRTKGIEAFTYSRPAEPSIAELRRLKKMEEIIEAVQPEEAPKSKIDGDYEALSKTWREKFRLWFNEKFGDWI